MRPPGFRKSPQDLLLLAFMGASRNNESFSWRNPDFFLEIFDLLGGHRGELDIRLQIPGHLDPLGRKADCLQPSSVTIGLDEKAVELAQQRLSQDSEPEISFEGALGYPPVDQEDRPASFLGLSEEVGPKFRFGQDEQVGPQPGKKSPDCPAQIQRDQEDRIGLGQLLLGDPIAGIGQG